MANTTKGRFLYDDKEDAFTTTFDMKPFNKNIYINVNTQGELLDVGERFTKQTMKDLKDIWSKMYDLPDFQLYALLGFGVQASYATFSPHRSHLWLTGTTGSGKSNVIIRCFFGDLFDGIAAVSYTHLTLPTTPYV